MYPLVNWCILYGFFTAAVWDEVAATAAYSPNKETSRHFYYLYIYILHFGVKSIQIVIGERKKSGKEVIFFLDELICVCCVIVADERKFHIFSSTILPNKDTNVNFLFESIAVWFEWLQKQSRKPHTENVIEWARETLSKWSYRLIRFTQI